jgi:hypothetical protein
MPYLRQEEKSVINNCFVGSFCPENAGQLQYAIAQMIDNYHLKYGRNYRNCNEIMGALNGANQEYYRRVVAPYEDTKIHSNGDCYSIGSY